MKKQTKLSVRDLKARKDIKGGSPRQNNQTGNVGKNQYTSITPKNQT
jgi:hypothetical protein